jgi:DNA-directed RNA polymerase subunit RPC12/RpoP
MSRRSLAVRGIRGAKDRQHQARMVGVSCDECGTALAVEETRAESPGPVTCDECHHHCRDHLEPSPADPMLPDHIEPFTCARCGQWWELDTDTGRYHVDN